MQAHQPHQMSSYIFWLLTQFIIFVVLFIYLDYFYLTNIRPDLLAKENFAHTPCLIMSKKYSSKGHIFHKGKAEFLISYSAAGVQYSRWVSGNGLDASYTMQKGQHDQVLAEYRVGGNYTCLYNPEDPEKVLLVPRQFLPSLLQALVPGMICLITFLLFIKNSLRVSAMVKDGQS